ncbi:MAG: sugar ABC transporter substrate-binding protein [Mesorhizobium sp.]|nr:MAG: sugar ABC transporter substrate-binding protein [Mesorhizobium sp.]
MNKNIGRILLGGLAAASLMANAASAKDLVFGLIPNTMAYPYDVVLVNGFKEKAEANGVKVILLDPKMSMETQANQIDDLILQKVDGIAFMPNDSVTVQSLVDKVAEAGIPIVASAVPVGDPNTHPVDYVYPNLTALVTTNDIEAGHVAGIYAAGVLPKDREAKIAVVEGAPGFSVVKQRQQGFEAALNEAKIKFKIVSSQPSDWTPASGERICQNALIANPDLDMIFSHADDMAIGCAKAIEAASAKALLIATGGGSDLGDNSLTSGEMDASVCTQPKLIGELSFDALFKALSNPAEAKKAQYIDYKLFPLTKENVGDCPRW